MFIKSNSSTIKKGTSLQELREVLLSCRELPYVNLDTETKHIRNAILDAEVWIYNNQDTLKALDIAIDDPSCNVCFNPSEVSASSSDDDSNAEDKSMELSPTNKQQNTCINESVMHKLMKTTLSFNIKFRELRYCLYAIICFVSAELLCF